MGCRRESPIEEKAMQANTFKRSLVAVAVVGAFATGVVLADRVGVNPAHAAAAHPTAPL